MIQITASDKETQALMPFAFGAAVAENMVVPLEVVDTSAAYRERWIDGDEVSLADCDGWHTRQSDSHLVAVFKSQASDIMSLTESVYQQCFQLAERLGFPHLIRTWNYFPDINGVDRGLERYQQFCVARQMVLNRFPSFEKQNPAATAIGGHGNESLFVFMFSKTAGVAIENTRQVPAWQYPDQYAPKQPRFARGMVYDGVLMCSGTASVVGHETKHEGDFSKQLDETIRNVRQVMLESNQHVDLAEGWFRFYLRDLDDLELLKSRLTALGIEQYVVLLGAVCRENLLIECEAVFHIG